MGELRQHFAVVGHDMTYKVDTPMLGGPEFGPAGPMTTLADVAVRLDKWHSRICGCGLDLHLADNVWLAMIPRESEIQDDALLEDYYPHESQRIDPQTQLTDARLADDSAFGSITALFGLEPGLDVRRAQFKGVQSLSGDICRVSHDPYPSLPGPNVTEYREILATPGTCFVLKASILESWYLQNRFAPIPIIRRPAGYGKTSFVSMCCVVFGDCPFPPVVPVFAVQACDDWHSQPVLRLDFSELRLVDCPSEADMSTAADQFMQHAAQELWNRYLPKEMYVRNEHYDSPHCMIKALSTRYRKQLYLAIDNYTHPFLTTEAFTYNLIEHVIWHRVLAPMLDTDGDASGVILRGIIVGTQEHGVAPFASFPAFARATRDLTYSVEHAAAIGLTPADVRGLARAVLRGGPGPECAREREFLAACRLPPAGDGDDVLLRTSDVLSLLRAYKLGQPPASDTAPYRFAAGRYMDPVEFDGPPDYEPSTLVVVSAEAPRH